MSGVGNSVVGAGALPPNPGQTTEREAVSLRCERPAIAAIPLGLIHGSIGGAGDSLHGRTVPRRISHVNRCCDRARPPVRHLERCVCHPTANTLGDSACHVQRGVGKHREEMDRCDLVARTPCPGARKAPRSDTSPDNSPSARPPASLPPQIAGPSTAQEVAYGPVRSDGRGKDCDQEV